MDSIKTLEVFAAVTRAEGKVLVCTRPAGKDFAGLWEFPGGKAHCGETPHQCLAREIREEISLEIVVLDEIFRSCHECKDRKIILRFFRSFALHSVSSIRPNEGQAFKWVALETLPSLNFPPADIPFVRFLTI